MASLLHHFILEKQRGQLVPGGFYAVAFSLAWFCHTQGSWRQTCLLAEQGRLPSIALPHSLRHATLLCWDIRLLFTFLWSKSDSNTVYVNHLPLSIIWPHSTIASCRHGTVAEPGWGKGKAMPLRGCTLLAPWGLQQCSLRAQFPVHHGSKQCPTVTVMATRGLLQLGEERRLDKGILKHKLFKAFSCPLFPPHGCLSPVLRQADPSPGQCDPWQAEWRGGEPWSPRPRRGLQANGISEARSPQGECQGGYSRWSW